MRASEAINRRYDFLYLFDVKDGNPNGDPDFANTPRFDPETFQGLVSDVSLKRKIRDYVFALMSSSGRPEKGYDIYVLQGQSLEDRQKMPYENLKELKGKAKDADTDVGDVARARSWMCENFFDVRTFGAVMSTTKFRCGQVRGPVQITFARSVDRVFSAEHGITRVSQTTAKNQEEKKGAGTMGNKHTVAYGLYCAQGFVNPSLAGGKNGTGFTEADLGVLWKALVNMFDLDRSSARGLMAARNLFVFEHGSPLGDAPAHKLFECVTGGVRLKNEKEPPRAYADYTVPSLEEIRECVKKKGYDSIAVSDKANL